jgi:hypothetical protein
MTTPNNLNTDPLVLSEGGNLSNGNGHVEHASGNGTANGPTVGEHAVNAKNSLVNCKVRDALRIWETRYPSGACRAAANLQNQSYRTVPTHAIRNTL